MSNTKVDYYRDVIRQAHQMSLDHCQGRNWDLIKYLDSALKNEPDEPEPLSFGEFQDEHEGCYPQGDDF